MVLIVDFEIQPLQGEAPTYFKRKGAERRLFLFYTMRSAKSALDTEEDCAYDGY